MTITQLDTIAVGAPITRLGISFIPLYLPDHDLPEIATGKDAGLKIEELEDAEVNRIEAYNPTDKPVLVVEGEHFLGGKQNRSVNATVLVPPRKQQIIPVSCLERGRWGAPRKYQRSETFAPPSVRAVKNKGVNRSFAAEASREGDQGATWAQVERTLRKRGVRSSTSAAADADAVLERDRSLLAVTEELAARGPLPGQCGVAVAYGRHVAAVNLFGAPHLLAAHWEALVRSHLAESFPSDGRPSCARALRLTRRFGNMPAKSADGIGLGTEHRMEAEDIDGEELTGQALTLDGKLVHATIYSHAMVY